jgi:hypothetical protein
MHFHIETDPNTNAEDFLSQINWYSGRKARTLLSTEITVLLSVVSGSRSKRLIEIDSCTLIGREPIAAALAFSYIDTLKLTNVDFKSLYEKGLIKLIR